MISNILFIIYLSFMSCSIPMSIGIKYGYESSKLVWADSVMLVATRETQNACSVTEGVETCIPIGSVYGSGTAFVIDTVGENTVFMTAAHLCSRRSVNEDQYPTSSGETGLTEKITYEFGIIMGENIALVNNVLFYDEVDDICVFAIPALIGKQPLKMAKNVPNYGDDVWTIGAPVGYFTNTAKPITRGSYSGDSYRIVLGFNVSYSNYTMPTVGGMSGSPIVDHRGRVIGLVSAVHSEWHLLSFSPTLEQITAAKESAVLKLSSQNP